jgi:cyclic lactone autoinducer peptide
MKKLLFLITTLLFVVASANIALATGVSGHQPEVPSKLKK